MVEGMNVKYNDKNISRNITSLLTSLLTRAWFFVFIVITKVTLFTTRIMPLLTRSIILITHFAMFLPHDSFFVSRRIITAAITWKKTVVFQGNSLFCCAIHLSESCFKQRFRSDCLERLFQIWISFSHCCLDFSFHFLHLFCRSHYVKRSITSLTFLYLTCELDFECV